MFNLLIVDDESAVVNGLAYDIDWSDLDIGERFRAFNGTQALEHLRKNRIDIVISDIRMPEIDGLELAAIIKKQWPNSKVIFMSGYNEFEYAQKAVELGIYGYILKPASDDEIKETVKKAIDEIEKELMDLEAVTRVEKQLLETAPLLLERYLNAYIVQGRTEALKEIKQWMPEYLPGKTDSNAFLILIRVDEAGHDNKQDGIYEVVIQNLIKKILLKDEHGLIFQDPEGNHVVLIQKKDENELGEFHQYIQGTAETFQLSVHRSTGCIISIFCGELIPTDSLHEAYNKIISLMRRSFRLYSGVIIGSQVPILRHNSNRLLSLPVIPAFSLLLETLQKDKCLMRIDEIFKEVEQNEGTAYETLLEVYFMVCSAILQDSNKRGIPIVKWAGEEEERYFSSFENLKSLENLKGWCRRSIEKYILCALSLEKGHTRHLVEEAKKFIIENLYEDISLSDIAVRLFVHPNYLCRIFKEDEGINITDYTTKLRIERAKKLLKETDMKVYEVAEELGYLSVAHFNRTFKRETGMTPKDYQVIQI